MIVMEIPSVTKASMVSLFEEEGRSVKTLRL